MVFKQELSLINKSNFILSSRRDNELVVLPQRGGATKKLDKIALPYGNLDFASSLRYFASLYMNKASAQSLDLSQNQDFNLRKVFI